MPIPFAVRSVIEKLTMAPTPRRTGTTISWKHHLTRVLIPALLFISMLFGMTHSFRSYNRQAANMKTPSAEMHAAETPPPPPLLQGTHLTARPSVAQKSHIGTSESSPNILFILADDHTAEAVGYREGSRLGALAETTHINKLAAQGAVIENSFAVLSLCSPSRATILTGVYPHRHGVTGLNGAIQPEVMTFVSILRRAGYRTGVVGKWHLKNAPSDRLMGFELYDVFIKQGSYLSPKMITNVADAAGNRSQLSLVPQRTRHRHNRTSIEVVTSSAIAFMQTWLDDDKTKAGEAEEQEEQGGVIPPRLAPFLLYCGFKETHEPWNYPKEYEHSLPSLLAMDFPPEPPTLKGIPAGRAGPLGALPSGWPLEVLGDRMVQFEQQHGGIIEKSYSGQTTFNAKQYEKARARAKASSKMMTTTAAAVATSTKSTNDGSSSGSDSDNNDDDEIQEWQPLFVARRLVHRKMVRDYLRTGKAMDDAVGKLLGFLDDHELSENTLVVYTSDQGYFLGEHNLFDKRFMWEESIRCPTVIRFPREIAPGTRLGGDSGLLVSNTDWAPTLLDYALGDEAEEAAAEAAEEEEEEAGDNAAHSHKEDHPISMHGRSFRRYLATARRGEKGAEPRPSEHRRALYYRYYGDNRQPQTRPAHIGIRTRRFKLILYYGVRCNRELWDRFNEHRSGSSSSSSSSSNSNSSGVSGGGENRSEAALFGGPWELYDLAADPLETTNSFSAMLRQNATLVNSLQRQLAFEMASEGGDDNSFQTVANDYKASLPSECLSLSFDSPEFLSCLSGPGCSTRQPMRQVLPARRDGRSVKHGQRRQAALLQKSKELHLMRQRKAARRVERSYTPKSYRPSLTLRGRTEQVLKVGVKLPDRRREFAGGAEELPRHQSYGHRVQVQQSKQQQQRQQGAKQQQQQQQQQQLNKKQSSTTLEREEPKPLAKQLSIVEKLRQQRTKQRMEQHRRHYELRLKQQQQNEHVKEQQEQQFQQRQGHLQQQRKQLIPAWILHGESNSEQRRRRLQALKATDVSSAVQAARTERERSDNHHNHYGRSSSSRLYHSGVHISRDKGVNEFGRPVKEPPDRVGGSFFGLGVRPKPKLKRRHRSEGLKVQQGYCRPPEGTTWVIGTNHKTGTYLTSAVVRDVSREFQIEVLHHGTSDAKSGCGAASSALDKTCIGSDSSLQRRIVLDVHIHLKSWPGVISGGGGGGGRGGGGGGGGGEGAPPGDGLVRPSLRRSVLAVNWVRDPLEVVLSGYFYHQVTTEVWVRSKASKTEAIAPLLRLCPTDDAPAAIAEPAFCTTGTQLRLRSAASYQELLVDLPPATGVLVEAARALPAAIRLMADTFDAFATTPSAANGTRRAMNQDLGAVMGDGNYTATFRALFRLLGVEGERDLAACDELAKWHDIAAATSSSSSTRRRLKCHKAHGHCSEAKHAFSPGHGQAALRKELRGVLEDDPWFQAEIEPIRRKMGYTTAPPPQTPPP